MQNILKNTVGLKILVIENEIGEEGIDHELLLQNPKEDIILMNNGCICCTGLLKSFHKQLHSHSLSRIKNQSLHSL